MNNADKPINPTLELDYTESIIQGINVFFNQQFGLTKREYFAVVALQGILSNRWSMEFGNYNEEQKAEMAIKYADELLKQLEDD